MPLFLICQEKEIVMSTYYRELLDYIETVRPISTHSHHLPDHIFQKKFDLDAILSSSYCDSFWCGAELQHGEQKLENYINLLKNRNFFKCTEKALQVLYGLDDPLRPETYSQFDARVKAAYESDPDHHLALLRDDCGYDRIILDAYWNPGDDNGHPEIFSPALRIDSFIMGLDPKLNQGGNLHEREYNRNRFCNTELYGERFSDGNFDDYCRAVQNVITERVKGNAVALKCAIAYQRGLDIDAVSEQQARSIFEKKESERSEGDLKAFEDYMFCYICRIAAALDVPLQVHTGLGRLYRTNASYLQPVIEANPDTRFVLLHGSYPWLDDMLGLVHKYPNNVFPDIVWLPMISLDAAIYMTSELIAVSNAHSICWGDDTWTSEEGYGSLLAVRHVLATVLARKVEQGYLSLQESFEVAANILRENARRLYRL